MSSATPAAHEAIRKCYAILGRDYDPVSRAWDGMDSSERLFWLKMSKLPLRLSNSDWRKMPGDAAAVLKNNWFRAARRAGEILGVKVMP